MNKTGFIGSMFTVMRKELRDFARDRRTFLLTLFTAPLLYPLLFLGIDKLSNLRVENQLEKDMALPVVGMDPSPLQIFSDTSAPPSSTRTTSHRSYGNGSGSS